MTILGQTVLAFTASEPVQPEIPSYGTQLVQTLIALVVVCILAYVVLRWGLARFMGHRPTQGPMEILARLSLDSRQGLVVVRVADRVFLLGTGTNALNLLTELDPDRWSEEMAHWADVKGPSLFQRVLQSTGLSHESYSPAREERSRRNGAPSRKEKTSETSSETSQERDESSTKEGSDS